MIGTFEKNKPTIALNILCIKIKKEARRAYISKINWNCEKKNRIHDSK